MLLTPDPYPPFARPAYPASLAPRCVPHALSLAGSQSAAPPLTQELLWPQPRPPPCANEKCFGVGDAADLGLSVGVSMDVDMYAAYDGVRPPDVTLPRLAEVVPPALLHPDPPFGAAYVLDGGWPAWQAAGGEVDTQDPVPVPTTFTPNVQSGFVASAADVAARGGDVHLIDSRAPERYRGDTEPLDRKAGHIPGAVNRPFGEGLNADGTFKAAEAQATRLAFGDAPTITYCGSGVSATPNLLARELAGTPLGPRNRLYAGSWSDWVSNDERPIEVGE